MPYLDLGNLRMFYTDDRPLAGEGAVLFVHGWGGDSQDWADVLWRMPDALRLIAPDLRGHGASRCGAGCGTGSARFEPDDYHPRRYAEDMAGLLRSLGTGPVTAVGHSMGGQVVTALAVEHPELVSSLVVLDPAYGADQAEAAAIPEQQEALVREGVSWAVGFVAGAYSQDAPPVARVRQERAMLSMDPRVLLAAREGMYLTPDAFGVRGSTEAYLDRRQCPVLSVFSQELVADWHRAHAPGGPGSRIVAWPGTGHYLHQERPADVAELLVQWAAGRGRPCDRSPRRLPASLVLGSA